MAFAVSPLSRVVLTWYRLPCFAVRSSRRRQGSSMLCEMRCRAYPFASPMLQQRFRLSLHG